MLKKIPIILLLLPLIAHAAPYTAGPGSLTPPSDATKVLPIDWSTFKPILPTDHEFTLLTAILQNSNKYALTTWWTSKKKYAAQDASDYLTFSPKKDGPPAETEIRPPADESFALAVSLKLHLYNENLTHIPEKIALQRTLRLLRSIAHAHKINSENGWGDQWQSAQWAATTGQAAWLLWDQLPPADQEQVRRMVEYEANRFLDYKVPYYQDPTGRIITPGDTKGEENAWNAFDLSVACAMMPHHPNYQKWTDKNLEMMISAFARPSDLTRSDVLNGKPLKLWLHGSNANEDGTLINHDRVHPDYMVAGPFENCPIALTFLAHQPLPAATFFNADIVYHALTDLPFTPGQSPYPIGGPIQPPGGTIYNPTSAKIYCPQGNDWGATRLMNFVLADITAEALHADSLSTTKASTFALLHTQAALDMQSRSTDGRTYITPAEDKYPGREEWIANRAATASLIKWTTHQSPLKITSAPLP